MGELTDAAIAEALERGRMAQRSEPRAASARYDRRTRRIVIKLTDANTFSFPARLPQGLEGASDDQLAGVAILGNGTGLHWEALDVDLSVPGILGRVFGTEAYMAQLAGRPTNAVLRRATEKPAAQRAAKRASTAR